MLQALEWIYGPYAASDPYYQVLRDFIILLPWWYPYIWAALVGGVFFYRGLRRWRVRRLTKRGVARVRGRTHRLVDAERRARERSARRRHAANDDAVPPLPVRNSSAGERRSPARA